MQMPPPPLLLNVATLRRFVFEARELADLSQRALAAEAGVSRAQVTRMEAGDPSVSVGAVERVTLALHARGIGLGPDGRATTADFALQRRG